MATAEGLSKTVKVEGMRYYDVGVDKLFPSVTTILGAMTDKSGLDQWRSRVGHEKADQISRQAANRGTVMHQLIEYYLLSNEQTAKAKLREAQERITAFAGEQGFSTEEVQIGRKLFYNFYNSGSFEQIAEVVSIEETLYCYREGGYAGRVDTIYRKPTGELIISDYKTSKGPKKLEWIDNYLMQVSAYFVAYWEMTGERPAGCEIWISNEQDQEPQIFSMTMEEIKVNAAKFLGLVKAFHAQHA